jgi:hypothetical protein
LAKILIVDHDPAVQIAIRLLLVARLQKPFRPEALLAAVDGGLEMARPSSPGNPMPAPDDRIIRAHRSKTSGAIPAAARRPT